MNKLPLYRTLLQKAMLMVALSVLVSCTTREGFQATDIGYIYNMRDLAPRPEFIVHHTSNTSSRVYYRFNSADLLYMRQPEQTTYKANFRIDYTLIESFEVIASLDSGIVSIVDEAPKPRQQPISGYFDITYSKESLDKQYVLKLSMIDENRQVRFDNFVRIDKSSEMVPSNFLMTDTAGIPIYKNHIATNTPFLIDYSGKPTTKYYVSYYNRDFPLALPPYSSSNETTFEIEPDTTYLVKSDDVLSLPKQGFYHFRTDTSQWKGYTVYSFYDQFPYIAKRVHLGPPLRYLTTKKEYNELSENFDNPEELKKLVDDFWLERTGSMERSKIILGTYYNRVQEANIFFSSYLEGWKTDRGIIYVVYGPPNKVYRSSAGEGWVYGDENSALSYYFSFNKVPNPFTENDFLLDRMSSYRYGWGQAIEAWRNGHAYNSKDIKREQDEQQNQFQPGTPYWY